MDDKTRGIYDKFFVERTDGESAPGGKHHGCDYFVLDITHDPAAVAAVEAYVKACEDDYPQLAADLTDRIQPLKKREYDRFMRSMIAIGSR